MCHWRRSLAVLVLVAGVACADGGYFPVTSGVAQTADQRAVIIDHGGAQTIVLQTGYRGDASEFAWVIPTPTRLVGASAVSTADPAVFSTLDRITAPTYWVSSGGGPVLCGCAGSDGDGGPVRSAVTVWDTFSVENYDLAILSAEQSTSLAAWLTDNGYELPAGTADVLEHYVRNEWYFVAMKLTPARGDGGTANGGGAGDGDELRPVTLTFETDELVFPLHISRVSTTERVEVLLYVISEHRVRSSTYATADIQARSSWRGDSFERVYDGWFEETIASAGGAALVVEFAGALPTWTARQTPLRSLLASEQEYYVTRLRTRLTPQQMADDIVLVAAPTDPDLEVVVASAVAGTRARLAMAALLLAAVQAVGFRRWPRARKLASGTVLLAIFIVLL